MISVIMATYNGERFLYNQLDSIKNQTLKPDEVIIADDGSSDKTIEIVQSFIQENQLDSWKLIVNLQNKGFQKNFMDLIEIAQGDIVFFADQDDIWLPLKIEHMVLTLQKHPQIWSLSCAYQFIDEKSNVIAATYRSEKKSKKLSRVNFHSFLDNRAYPGMSMAIKKECKSFTKKLRGLPLIAHDWAINIICSALGKMYYLDETLTLYRQHENNTIGSSLKPVHEFHEQRCALLSNQIKHYDQATRILEMMPEVPPNELFFVSKKRELYLKRKTYLETKSFFHLVSLIKYLKYYPSIKTYGGDLLSGFYFLKHSNSISHKKV